MSKSPFVLPGGCLGWEGGSSSAVFSYMPSRRSYWCGNIVRKSIGASLVSPCIQVGFIRCKVDLADTGIHMAESRVLTRLCDAFAAPIATRILIHRDAWESHLRATPGPATGPATPSSSSRRLTRDSYSARRSRADAVVFSFDREDDASHQQCSTPLALFVETSLVIDSVEFGACHRNLGALCWGWCFVFCGIVIIQVVELTFETEHVLW